MFSRGLGLPCRGGTGVSGADLILRKMMHRYCDSGFSITMKLMELTIVHENSASIDPSGTGGWGLGGTVGSEILKLFNKVHLL